METDTRNRRRSRQARPAVEAMERRLTLSAAPGWIKQVATEVALPAKKALNSSAWSDGPVNDSPSVTVGIKQVLIGLTPSGKKADPTDAASTLIGSHRPPPDSSPAVASFGGLEKKVPAVATLAVDKAHPTPDPGTPSANGGPPGSTGGSKTPSIAPHPDPGPPPGGGTKLYPPEPIAPVLGEAIRSFPPEPITPMQGGAVSFCPPDPC